MAVIFSDDFNRANGDPGTDYDADDGSLTIVSNRLRAVGDVVGEAFVRPLDLSTDWYCEFQLPTLTGGAEFGVLFRDQLGSPDNKYLINVKEDAVAFKAAFAGSYNTEFSDGNSHSASDVYALRCEGDTFDFIKNGSTLYTFVDSTFATGYVLIYLNPNGDSANIELDNLVFTDVASGVAPRAMHHNRLRRTA